MKMLAQKCQRNAYWLVFVDNLCGKGKGMMQSRRRLICINSHAASWRNICDIVPPATFYDSGAGVQEDRYTLSPPLMQKVTPFLYYNNNAMSHICLCFITKGCWGRENPHRKESRPFTEKYASK